MNQSTRSCRRTASCTGCRCSSTAGSAISPIRATSCSCSRPAAVYNYGGYRNARFDALLGQAAQQPDNSERYRLLEQAEALLNEDGVYIPLYYYSTRHLVKPYVRAGTPISWIAICRATCTCSSTRDAEEMLRYILRRVFESIPTLLLIVTAAFALLHLAPGGPFIRPTRQCCRRSSASIEARYHLDEPLWRQYLRYLGDLAHGDLGPSFQYRNTSVNQIIANGFPVDATIGLSAIALALLVGVPVGLNAAWRHHSWWDRVPMALAVVGISVPVFVIAPVLVLVFAVQVALAARGRLGARLAVPPAAAGARPRAALRRLYRPHRARQRARGARHGLHPHRPG